MANLGCQLDTPDKRELQLDFLPSDWSVGMAMGRFLHQQLKQEGQTQCGSSIPGQLGQGCIGMVAEPLPRSRSGTRVPPWFRLQAPALSSSSSFLQWGMGTRKLN